MSLRTRLFGRLLFSKEERATLRRAEHTSRHAKRVLYGLNVPIGAILVVLLLGAMAYAVVYYSQQVSMTFNLKATWQISVEDVSNVAQTSIAYGEFDFSQKKNASNINHLRNMATEAIIVRYVVSVPSGWAITVYLGSGASSTIWLSTDSLSMAYSSTQIIRIQLTAPSSGQSTPQVGSVTFNVVDA